MKMTPARIEEARERCKKATWGAWTISGGWALRGQQSTSEIFANAEFIATARVDLPDALDDLEEMRRALRERCIKVGGLECLLERAHTNSKKHGFWTDLDPQSCNTKLMKIALIMSELGEAVEAARRGDTDNFAEELADTCIRVFDLAAACGVDLEREVTGKMDRNEARVYKHGKLA